MYNAQEMGALIQDFRTKNKLTREQLSKKMEEYDTSLSADVLGKYENGNCTKEIGVKKLIALSQIFNVSIDDLVNNNVTTKDYDVMFCNKLGITKKSLKQIKQIKKDSKPKRTLFDIKGKYVDDISELDALNHILSNGNIIRIFKEEAINILKNEYDIRNTERELDNSPINMSEETKKINKNQLKKDRNKYIKERENILAESVIQMFEQFVIKQKKSISN